MDAEIPVDKFIEYITSDFPTFKITKCNLTYPTTEFVTSFYTLMIEAITELSNVGQLCNLTEEQVALLNQNQREGNSFIQHVYSRNVHNVAKYIFNRLNISVPEFNYSDILIPELSPRRAYLFMSLMLNSYYTAISFSEEMEEGMAACQEKCLKLHATREKKEELLDRLKSLEEQKAADCESVRVAKANALKLSAANKENEFILKDLEATHGSLEAELRKAEERESSLNEELLKIEEEIQANENLIVLNPDEAAEVLAKNEQKKIKCKDKLKRHEEEVRIASHKISRFDEIAELQQVIKNIILPGDHNSPHDFAKKDFKELQSCINNLNGKLSKLKNAMSALMLKLNVRESVVLKLKNELAQRESEEAGIICKREERCRMYNEYLENRDKTHTQRSIVMKKEAEEVRETAAQIPALEKACAELESKILAVDQETKERYISCVNRLKNAFDLVHKALTS